MRNLIRTLPKVREITKTMNREIKFRAWDKLEAKMLYRTIYDRNWYSTPANDEDGAHCVRSITPIDRARLDITQFTGLKDKNGEEIYEGDIVEFPSLTGSFRGEVQYAENNANFLYAAMPSVEVIGNIYENPELIKNQ